MTNRDVGYPQSTFRSMGWMSGCRRWQISRHLRETQIGDWFGTSAGARRWHTETDGLFVLWVLNSTTVQFVLQPLITFLDYLLQLATAMLFFFFFLADVTKVCGGHTKRSHQTSRLIFIIYLIWLFFFLTKQFPRKPEHTKCIKKTVQSVWSCLDVV